MNSNHVRVQIQKFGSFLSSMIMPNIGAFIAWGVITAIFLETGWYPNEHIAEMIGPILQWMLPILVAYTAGYNVYEKRGGVIGTIASMGAFIGASIPMFLASMIISPISAFLLKRIDKLLLGKVKAGFEMLVNNFSLGILGAILSIVSYLAVGPLIQSLNYIFMSGVQLLLDHGLFPLISLIAEPAKVLFLNNALDHGVLGPIALNQVAENGKSFLFLVIQNPGPGLGVLLAYTLFGKGSAKQSAPGAIIIHFFGGIHEIYFPYVLMNPLLLIALIAGGSVGLLVFHIFGSGMVAAASPGSIFAILAMTERHSYLGIVLGILISTIISFVISVIFVKMSKNETDLDKSIEQSSSMKIKKVKEEPSVSDKVNNIDDLPINIKYVVFACDAGMGSSAMGASILRKKFKDNGLDMNVTNYAISNLPSEAELIITHQDLTDRAIQSRPDAFHISVDNFLTSDKYDEIVKHFKQ